MSGEPAIKCPHCGNALAHDIVTTLANESRVAIALTPAPNELMTAETVGGAVTNAAKLFRAVGKEMGIKTAVLVERMTCDDDGTLTFHLLLARHGNKPEPATS